MGKLFIPRYAVTVTCRNDTGYHTVCVETDGTTPELAEKKVRKFLWQAWRCAYVTRVHGIVSMEDGNA